MTTYRHYFALEKQLQAAGYPINRHDIIREVTGGRKIGLSDLTTQEYSALIDHMRRVAAKTEDPAMNRMRKKIIALFRKMGYEQQVGQVIKADMARIYSWVHQYGLYHKNLNQHSKAELAKLVGQVDNMYQSHMKEVHRS